MRGSQRDWIGEISEVHWRGWREGEVMASVPPVVSNRNEFPSALREVEFALSWFAAAFPDFDRQRLPELEKWLYNLTRQIAHDLTWALKTGAERGIEQAANLALDPNYYEKKKQRFKRAREQAAVKSAAEKRERLERQVIGPSETELRQKRMRLEYDVAWHRRELERCELELKNFPVLKNLVTFKGPTQ